MKKNIVFILPDQMRADYLGCYGATFAKTPNIDKLSEEGTQYCNAISPSPICVPARASLLTGENSVVNGVLQNSVWLRPDHEECGLKTWPKQLSENGYETIAVGKMHFYPWDAKEGFQKRIISEDKRHFLVEDDYADYLKEKKLKKFRAIDCKGYAEDKGAMYNPLPKEDQADAWIARKASEYIDSYAEDKPFAMMVGFVSPHDPYDPDKSYADLFKSIEMPEPIPSTEDSESFLPGLIEAYKAPWAQVDYSNFTLEQKKKVKAYYSACIHDIDVGVGKIVEALKKKGIYEDTVIIFSSDHGDFVGDFGLMGKYQFYEPSIHVPLIVKDTALEKKGIKKEELVSLTDVYSTILHIAGIDDKETEDSKILSCYKEKTYENRVIFGATDIGYMIRSKKWKYSRYRSGLTILIDLENDKQEQNNIAYKKETMEIMKELDEHMQSKLIDSMFRGNTEKNADFTFQMEKGPFFRRDWGRPYPVKISKVEK
ncbi:sulfatase family protein [Clostridium sp. DL1XJH146]